MADAETAELVRPIRADFVVKVFYAFAALAIISLVISMGGKWLGKSIAMAGHTDDATTREIVIGNNVLVIPANTIRFEKARHSGVAGRIDLYLRWPALEGYSNTHRAAFNHENGLREIIFLTFEDRMTSRDMSGRFEPIYSALIEQQGTPGPGGLVRYGFRAQSGYVDETLMVGQRPGQTPFVARCLTGAAGEESLAPCERDIHLGDDLSLTYRFPSALLGAWKALDASVMARAVGYLQTTR